jgi:hypothetical protein
MPERISQDPDFLSFGVRRALEQHVATTLPFHFVAWLEEQLL